MAADRGRQPLGDHCADKRTALVDSTSHVEDGLPPGPEHVLALQRSAGNRAITRLLRSRRQTDDYLVTRRPGLAELSLQRKVTKNAQGGWLMQFTVGTEITSEFAAEAFQRTVSGPLTDGDLAELRKLALNSDRSIDHDEGIFIAALLDGPNAAQLHKAYPSGGFGVGKSVTFTSDTITAANRERVRDFDREPPDSPISMQIGGKPAGFKTQILKLAGGRFSATALQILELAKSQKVAPERVHEAMLAAASDSTAGDRALAGAAYVIAKRAKLPQADDLLKGNIKVDEVPPSYLGGVSALYMTMGGDQAQKGDTVYLPTTFDISSLAHQSLVVHELTHAGQDKAATTLTQEDLGRVELGGYRAQSRYLLNQLVPLRGRDLTTAISKLAPEIFDAIILTMMLEDRALTQMNPTKLTNRGDLTFKLNKACPKGLITKVFDDANEESDQDLEQRAIDTIRKYPPYKRPFTSNDGLRGESGYLDE